MNASFFIFWEKVKPFLSKVFEIMQPRIREKLKVKERMLQAVLWAIVFCTISIPVSEFSLYLVELADNNSVAGTFWFIVAVGALELEFLSLIYLMIITPCFFIFIVYKATEASLKEIRKPKE